MSPVPGGVSRSSLCGTHRRGKSAGARIWRVGSGRCSRYASRRLMQLGLTLFSVSLPSIARNLSASRSKPL